MLVIQARNVNDAYAQGLALLRTHGIEEPSRAGTVLTAQCPVTTVYMRPTERVLFDPHRDANPFFHLFEALWMLAGRHDAKWLDQFVSDFSSRFAEPGLAGISHGAYGHRWRGNWDADQLDVVVARLRKDPKDRRVVVTMWDPSIDLLDPRDPDGMGYEPKDLPCNTHVYPRIIDNHLDITICCRSNDVVWGAYGANAVHFSVLQEYLAGRLQCNVGTMYQVSNNWHGYTSILEKLHVGVASEDPYKNPRSAIRPVNMGQEWGLWDRDLRRFMDDERHINGTLGTLPESPYVNDWFANVAEPMLLGHRIWKMTRDLPRTMRALEHVAAPDWRMACEKWVQRRAHVMQGVVA